MARVSGPCPPCLGKCAAKVKSFYCICGPRYGYFPGVPLQPAPPVVYLVAPALRFHPASEILVRYLNPRMEVVRVGLAESWRRGLSVELRQ